MAEQNIPKEQLWKALSEPNEKNCLSCLSRRRMIERKTRTCQPDLPDNSCWDDEGIPALYIYDRGQLIVE